MVQASIKLNTTTYRPDIDGLRAIAVISVLIYHLNSAWLPGGFVGVDIFFVISGFVVTSSLAFSEANSFYAFISEFYARRLARILPVLVFVLVVSAVAATLFIPSAWLSQFSDSTALHAFWGLSNWVMQNNLDTYFAPRAELNPYTHTWSLGVEEQFYVIAPLLVYLWVRAVRCNGNKGQKRAVLTLILITILSLVGCIIASKTHPNVAFYSIGCRLWELAFGALLFLTTNQSSDMNGRQPKKNVLHHVYPWLGLGFNLIALFFAKSSHFPWPWAVLPAVGTLLLIGSAKTRPKENIVGRVLSLKPMVWIGKRSYSLYLWHWPVYVLLRWTVGLNTATLYIVAIFITFTLSSFSFRWIEQPFRHNPWIELRPKLFRIAGFLLLPIIGFLFAKFIFKNKQTYSLSCVMRNKVDWYSEMSMPYPNIGKRYYKVKIETHKIAGGIEVRYVPVEPRIRLPNKKMYVMGDSHAAAFSPMYEQLCAEQGITVSLFTFPGCSYINLKYPMEAKTSSASCIEFSNTIKNIAVTTSNPDDIVLLPSLRMARYSDQETYFNITDMHEHMYNPGAQKLREAAFEDAKQWLQPFSDKQMKVIFVAPTPVFKAPTFRCADWFNQNNPICVGQNQQSRAELESLRKPIIDNMNSLAKLLPNISVWDAFPILCPNEICRSIEGDKPLFFDSDHISAYGNSIIYPDFRRTILESNSKFSNLLEIK